MPFQINSNTVIDDDRNIITTESISGTTVSGNWIASNTEAQSGTDNTQIITPLGLRKATYSDGDSLEVPIYAARAWVVFDATTGFNDNRNVSSITTLATGYFKLNFLTAMPDANYAVAATTNQIVGDDLVLSIGVVAGTLTTSNFEFRVRGRIFNDSATNRNPEHASIAIYR